ncbi:MAG: hypothetical protein SFV51_32325, partial [Bryobacteraceae bacterium]|nr:hypothetical protein [Bryobacteraceae bacterium]
KLVGEGLGFTKMQPDGLELMGTLMFLKSVASTAPVQWRGWFVRNGSVMDATRIAALAGIPVAKVERALTFFSTPPMDWLLFEEWPGDTASARGRHSGDTASARGRQAEGGKSALTEVLTDVRTDLLTDPKEREREEKAELDGKELRARQTAQFAAANARLQKLEAVSRDERTPEQRAEIKKTRDVINAIQRKQARGDFAPVEENAK